MYLLRHDPTHASRERYSQLSQIVSDQHLRSLSPLAMGLDDCTACASLPEAARLMDEQIQKYPAGIEVPSPPSTGVPASSRPKSPTLPPPYAYYHVLSESYCNFYYADLARRRMRVLGQQPETAPSMVLAAVRRPTTPSLEDAVPEDDSHYIKAKLLANAALNEYISPEITASPTFVPRGEIWRRQRSTRPFGEFTRALQSMKHSRLSFFTQPVGSGAGGVLASAVSAALLG